MNDTERLTLIAAALRSLRSTGFISATSVACRQAAGFFLPDESFREKDRAASEKQRAVLYGLCDSCPALPDEERSRKLEERMLRDVQVC